MSDINFIKPKNSLRQKEKKEKIKKVIKARVTEIADYQTFRGNQELILLICNCVENLVKKKYGIDKKLFVVEILQEIFNLNSHEQTQASETCQFLFDNLLIQAVPAVEKAKYYTWNWIKRKLG